MPNAAVLILKRFAAFQAPAFGAVRQAIAGVSAPAEIVASFVAGKVGEIVINPLDLPGISPGRQSKTAA